ncbi:uncharacterized protein LOC144314386 [Canis aureus]
MGAPRQLGRRAATGASRPAGGGTCGTRPAAALGSPVFPRVLEAPTPRPSGPRRAAPPRGAFEVGRASPGDGGSGLGVLSKEQEYLSQKLSGSMAQGPVTGGPQCLLRSPTLQPMA